MKNKFKLYTGLEKNFQVSAMNYLSLKGYLSVHTPNEVKGSVQFHVKRKKEGLKKGFPDISVLEPSKGYNGLFIELKVKYNKPSDHQIKWIKDLNKRGYFACWTNSFDEFKHIVDSYFNSENDIILDHKKTFRSYDQ